MTRKIAFLGLGAMGSRMALRLVEAGFDVTVWNRSSDRAEALVASGATLADTPKAAADGAEIVLSMVRDDEASTLVWLDTETGALAGMPPGSVAVECSTITVDHARRLGQEAEARGLGFLDAPLAGSRPQAEAGQLIFLVGGAAETLGTVQPVLEAMGGAVHHAGDVEAGAAVKLAVNALFGVQVAAMAELLGLLDQSGVAIDRAVEIISATPVASPAVKGAADSMLAGAFAPMFPVELVEKDFGYALASGRSLPITAAGRSVMRTAIAQGYGGDNLTGVVQLYRDVSPATLAG